jgi:hypothetical protein
MVMGKNTAKRASDPEANREEGELSDGGNQQDSLVTASSLS